MRTFIRTLIYVALLITLGVGIRLMYYGLQTVVGSAPHYGLSDVILLLVGIIFFVSGIIGGIRFLSPSPDS